MLSGKLGGYLVMDSSIRQMSACSKANTPASETHLGSFLGLCSRPIWAGDWQQKPVGSSLGIQQAFAFILASVEVMTREWLTLR